MVNNKIIFRRLLAINRRRVTGDRKVSRFDPSPSPFGLVTTYFMVSLFPFFTAFR